MPLPIRALSNGATPFVTHACDLDDTIKQATTRSDGAVVYHLARAPVGYGRRFGWLARRLLFDAAPLFGLAAPAFTRHDLTS
jgi:hypothetical protein